AVVVFRRDENKAVRCGYFSGPAFYNLSLVRWAAGHRGRQGLIKEGHGKIAKIEQSGFDSITLLQVLENPLRRLLRKPALTSAADDYRNSGHIVFPLLVVSKAFVTRR